MKPEFRNAVRDDQRTHHHIAKPLTRLGLAILARELVDGPGGLAADLFVLESLALEKCKCNIPVGADPCVGLLKIITCPGKMKHPYRLIGLDLRFNQAFHGDGAGVGLETGAALSDEVAPNRESQKETDSQHDRGKKKNSVLMRCHCAFFSFSQFYVCRRPGLSVSPNLLHKFPGSQNNILSLAVFAAARMGRSVTSVSSSLFSSVKSIPVRRFRCSRASINGFAITTAT